MLTAVFIFALVTALFEAVILAEFVSLRWMEKRWVKALVHTIAFGVNLAVHFGTITGTMTAVTAALVSFLVYPTVLWCKRFIVEWQAEHARVVMA